MKKQQNPYLHKMMFLTRRVGWPVLLIAIFIAISYLTIPGRTLVTVKFQGFFGIDLTWMPITPEIDYENPRRANLSFLVPWVSHWPQTGHVMTIRADGILIWDIIPDSKDHEPHTDAWVTDPLTVHRVLKNGDTDTAMTMLKAEPDLIHLRDKHLHETPLHIAAAMGYVSITEWLLQHGADVNAEAYNDFSPLHLAQNASIARILIEHQANPNQVDSWGNTPLQFAAINGKKEVAEVILASGHPMDLRSALMLGEREHVFKLVASNPAILMTQTKGSSLRGSTSPLGLAAGQGDVEIVKFLLANGAPVNSATYMPLRGNATPLTNAVWGGHLEVVNVLCASGANPNVASGGKFYKTVLDFAIVNSEAKMIGALIKCGAQPTNDTWRYITGRCVFIVRENLPTLLGTGFILIGIAAVVVNYRRKRR